MKETIRRGGVRERVREAGWLFSGLLSSAVAVYSSSITCGLKLNWIMSVKVVSQMMWN